MKICFPKEESPYLHDENRMNISDRLTFLARFYHKEAQRCSQGRAYLAACVMQGAALEGALHCLCFLYPDDVRRTAVFKRKKFRHKRNKALDFTYNELINIADELGWFPPRRFLIWGKRTNVAGWAHELRKLRNYVHPGVWAPQRPESLKFTKGVYAAVYEIFDVANSWLVHRVVQSLEKRMAREKGRKAGRLGDRPTETPNPPMEEKLGRA